jgi:hypothetical protein
MLKGDPDALRLSEEGAVTGPSIPEPNPKSKLGFCHLPQKVELRAQTSVHYRLRLRCSFNVSHSGIFAGNCIG